MGRNPKLTIVNKKHFTKEEKQAREEKEKLLIKNNRIDKIKPPLWLCSKGKKIFKEISKELIELKIINNLDVNALSMYCDYLVKIIEINKEIEQEGETIEYTNKFGATNIIENSKLKIKNKYFEIINKLSRELGLTPSSRSSFTCAPIIENEKNNIKKLFNRLDV